jgi:hypothetical protein
MSDILTDRFGVPKPIIAMVHLPALPGTPRHDPGVPIEQVIEALRSDIRALLEGGVDAVMFCNEDDRPYSLHAGPEAVATMTRIVVELRPTDRPFGVDYLWDPFAPLAIAKATGASFIREVITGVYESDMGLWAPDAAALYRYRRQIDATQIMVFDNIAPEFASPLGQRSVAERARSACISSLVDAILVSGLTAGMEVSLKDLRAAKGAVPPQVPVLANTGVNHSNMKRILDVADGAIVGSCMKVDGYTWNRVDPARVTRFMKEARLARKIMRGR